MHLLSNADTEGYSEKDAAMAEPDASLLRLNDALDKVAVPYVVNRGRIEYWLNELEMRKNGKNPVFWLLLIRLNELALLCAGNYADNCEFSAACDLLVNPGESIAHFNDTKQPVTEKRHCSLSGRFRREGRSGEYVLRLSADNAACETGRPPLLQQLFRMMQNSGRVSGSYLETAGTRMKRVADTIGFLAGWQISDTSELYRRISGSTPEIRAFIESNLCRFKNDLFFDIGNDVRRVAGDTTYRSDFLAYLSFVFPEEICCSWAS